MSRIVIVGGGISGLSLAYRLEQALPEAHVSVNATPPTSIVPVAPMTAADRRRSGSTPRVPSSRSAFASPAAAPIASTGEMLNE